MPKGLEKHSLGGKAKLGLAPEVGLPPEDPVELEQIIRLGGTGKGSFQGEKNEGHWARAREGCINCTLNAGRGTRSRAGSGWLGRGREGENAVWAWEEMEKSTR